MSIRERKKSDQNGKWYLLNVEAKILSSWMAAECMRSQVIPSLLTIMSGSVMESDLDREEVLVFL